MFLFPLTKSWKASVTCSWVLVFLKSLFTVPSSFCRREREEELIVPFKKRSETQSEWQFYTRAHVWYICAKTNFFVAKKLSLSERFHKSCFHIQLWSAHKNKHVLIIYGNYGSPFPPLNKKGNCDFLSYSSDFFSQNVLFREKSFFFFP